MQFGAIKVFNCEVNFLLKKIVFLNYSVNFQKHFFGPSLDGAPLPPWIRQCYQVLLAPTQYR